MVPGDGNSAGHHQLTICVGLVATLPVFVGVAFYRVHVAATDAALSGESTLLPEALALAAVALVFVAPLAKRVLPPGAGTLAAFVLREITGVVGLVITILTGDLVWCVALCVVALLAMVVDWPRRRQPL